MTGKTEILLFQLFRKYFFESPVSIRKIKGGVSDRNVYRIQSKNYVCTGVYNSKLKENIAFIEFSRSFRKCGLNVPEIYIVSGNSEYYLEEFLGDKSLYDLIKANKISGKAKITIYKKVLSDLINFQVKGRDTVNFKYCYETKTFNKKQISFDFEKFYNYYLKKQTEISIPKNQLNKIKANLLKELLMEKDLYFMYRDFQPRNIMLKEEKLFYIDYQSGRKGPLQYDVASFLYSGSINLNEKERKVLLSYYIRKIQEKVKTNAAKFKPIFYYFAFIRLIQVLGSYGYIYHMKKDRAVLKKIDKALNNIGLIKDYLKDKSIKDFACELIKS
jgi:aminoglycoside/choline kinase family phosphotransferase